MLADALKQTYGDRHILWRAPLLAVAAWTGVGLVIVLGYGFAVQNHIVDGREEYPDVGLDSVWYGAKYFAALIILAIPAFALIGGIAMPALLEVGVAGLESGSQVAGAWDAIQGRLAVFYVLMGIWLLALLAYLPGSMGAFLEDDGRLISALYPPRVLEFARDAGGAYAQMYVALVGWLLLTVAIYLPLELLAPTGSTVPILVVFFVLVPFGVSVILLLQTMLGRVRAEFEPAKVSERTTGWEQLQDQRTPEELEAAHPAAEADEGASPASSVAKNGANEAAPEPD